MTSFKNVIAVAVLLAVCSAVHAAAVNVDAVKPAEKVDMDSAVKIESGAAGHELGAAERSGGYGYKVKQCKYQKCADKIICRDVPYQHCYKHCYCKYGYRADVGEAADDSADLDSSARTYGCGYGSKYVCHDKCEMKYKKDCTKKHECHDEYRPCSKGY
jgi:opacity protein-like surface antigen